MIGLRESILESVARRTAGKYRSEESIDPDNLRPGDMVRIKWIMDRHLFDGLTSVQKKYLGDVVTVQEIHEPGFLGEKGYTVYVEENPELWKIELLRWI